MNLTKFAVLFVIISLPFYFISDMSVKQIQQQKTLEDQYSLIINNAVDDGTLALRLFAKEAYDDEHMKAVDVDAEEVVNAFLSSYEHGFGAIGETDRIKVRQYILALVIVGYDGYYIYSTKQVKDSGSGVISYQQILSEKYPYSYSDGVSTTMLTLDSTLDVKGYTITSIIEKRLAEAVEVHNRYTGNLGMGYHFHLPVYDNDSVGKNLSDIALLVFVQGQAIGGGHYMEVNAFNQGSVMVGDLYSGYEEVGISGGDSFYYYCDEECRHDHLNRGDHLTINQIIRRFSSQEEAASEGFWPCSYLGK